VSARDERRLERERQCSGFGDHERVARGARVARADRVIPRERAEPMREVLTFDRAVVGEHCGAEHEGGGIGRDLVGGARLGHERAVCVADLQRHVVVAQIARAAREHVPDADVADHHVDRDAFTRRRA
jgi:hypothetical protein